MAFLGGLMSGTTGAFIRGSLDTATDIIRANVARDEEGIDCLLYTSPSPRD